MWQVLQTRLDSCILNMSSTASKQKKDARSCSGESCYLIMSSLSWEKSYSWCCKVDEILWASPRLSAYLYCQKPYQFSRIPPENSCALLYKSRMRISDDRCIHPYGLYVTLHLCIVQSTVFTYLFLYCMYKLLGLARKILCYTSEEKIHDN